MFDRLIDLIAGFWQSLLPFYVLKPWEGGLVLRLGKFNRKAVDGFNWVIPFVEELISIDVQVHTNWTAPQTMTTADHQLVTVQWVVVWDIVDPVKALTVPDNIGDALRDTYIGAGGDMVSQSNLDDLNQRRFLSKIKKKCQDKAERYGVRIIDFNLAELAPCNAIRLIQNS